MHMKKIIALALSAALLLSMAACAGPEAQSTEPEVITAEVRAKLDAIAQEKNYRGIVYLTYNGKTVYEYVSGVNDMGKPLTVDSPMYICSISKQFCAAAVLMLRDQGKLSLDDTLEKYFPEYAAGKDVTLKNLLSMRSGICRDFDPVLENPELYLQKTPEEVNAEMMEWIFSRPLLFTPGTKFAYSNINYILLSYVVEAVSGQSYESFIRQNIFEPLGMTHSGFLNEVPDHPNWGLTYDNLYPGCTLGDQAQGCGDIVTTAADMDIWMNALQSGEVVCMESFREMTTNHNPESAHRYGYGLSGTSRDGWCHGGNNWGYSSYMYFSEKHGFNLYLVTNQTPLDNLGVSEQTCTAMLSIIYQAIEATGSHS